MRKLFLILSLCCCGNIVVSAQSTKVVKGAVVDKNGNPLPGAVVEATGGAESTVVDADGTFSIEVSMWLKSLTAKYAGMQTKKMNLKGGDMIFRMTPPKGKWFLNLEGSYCVDPSSGRIGLMAGYLGKWGGYFKLMPGLAEGVDGVPAAVMGVIKRVGGPVYAYLGIGYAPVVYEDYYYDYYYDYYDCYDYDPGAMVDGGFIFNIKKINLSVGYSYSGSGWGDNHDIHFGVGYCF